MPAPLARRSFGVAVALGVLIVACSGDGGEAELQSATIVPDPTSEPATTAPVAPTTDVTATSSTSTTAVASPEAVSFKALAPTLPDLGEAVHGFVGAVEPIRIDELAADACSSVAPGMNDTELGVEGIAAYNELTDDERATVDLEDWVILYGSLIGFFCPDNLPDLDGLVAPPADGTEVEQFRAVVTDVDGVSAEAESFVAGLSDERVDALQSRACDNTDTEMTTEDFGVAIVTSYDAELSAREQDDVSLTGYSELYGALVGWFCPANLPL